MEPAPQPSRAKPFVDPTRLVEEWAKGIRIIHTAHTRAAADYARWEQQLGLAVAIITAVTGSAIFANGAQGDSRPVLFVAGALAIIASVTAAAHTFLGFGALAAQHAAAAREYGLLRRDFEASLACGGDLPSLLETVRRRWGEIEAKFPFVSQKRYDRAQKAAAKSAGRPPSAKPPAAVPPAPGPTAA
jgi:hypothetical protein